MIAGYVQSLTSRQEFLNMKHFAKGVFAGCKITIGDDWPGDATAKKAFLELLPKNLPTFDDASVNEDGTSVGVACDLEKLLKVVLGCAGIQKLVVSKTGDIAAAAGLCVGDQVVGVNDKRIGAKSKVEGITSLIGGVPANTPFTLSVKRAGTVNVPVPQAQAMYMQPMAVAMQPVAVAAMATPVAEAVVAVPMAAPVGEATLQSV